MLTVPDNRKEDNPAVADAPTTTSAGEGSGSGGADGSRSVPPTLDTLAREGARRMLMTALEAEVREYIERFAEVRDADGHRLVVGTARRRSARDLRGGHVAGAAGERQAGRCRRLARAVRAAFCRPISGGRRRSSRCCIAGPVREALPALLGEDAAGLSPTTITRLTAAFTRRSPRECDYVHRDSLQHPPGGGPSVHRGWTERRSWWRWRTATGRARRTGRACCGTCGAAVCGRRRWRLVTGRWASGRRCGTFGRRRGRCHKLVSCRSVGRVRSGRFDRRLPPVE